VVFCKKINGVSEAFASWMNWAAFCASALNSTPRAFASTPTGYPCNSPQPVTSASPYAGLNSSKSLPSRIRASTSRGSNGTFRSALVMPSNSSGSYFGGCGTAVRGDGPCLRQFNRRTHCRASRMPSRSSAAR
jgi:hypothetical protein